jgi:hypothetical protein
MSNYKNRQERKGPSDYKEPYEFRLLIGDSIICQRYFKINNFNNLSLNSLELTNTIRGCAQMIDDDLKSKSRIYTWHMSPLVFNNEDEMYAWFNNPEHEEWVKKLRINENVFLRSEGLPEYTWTGEELILNEKRIGDGTFTDELHDKDIVTYELAFYVNEKKVVSTTFEGVYPYFIRRNIDLSNTRGKFEGDDITRLSFDSYILHTLVADRSDLIKRIVKEICYVCSVTDNDYYTLVDTYVGPNGKKVNYQLNLSKYSTMYPQWGPEIARAKAYYGNETKKN